MIIPLQSSSYLLFINLEYFSQVFNMLFVIITHLLHYIYLSIGHLCKLYSFLTNSHTTTPLYYILKRIELHMIYSSTQLFWHVLLPPMYNIMLHYIARCSNIHKIDEIKESVFLLTRWNRINGLVTMKMLLLKIKMNGTHIGIYGLKDACDILSFNEALHNR